MYLVRVFSGGWYITKDGIPHRSVYSTPSKAMAAIKRMKLGHVQFVPHT